MQAQADVELARIQADAEEKRRADEIRMEKIKAEAQEKKRTDAIQMAKREANKELALKEMELKAKDQASTSAAAAPSPRNRDAKSLKLRAFIDEKDETRHCTCYVLNTTLRMLVGRKTHRLLSGWHYLQEDPWKYIPGCPMETPVTTIR